MIARPFCIAVLMTFAVTICLSGCSPGSNFSPEDFKKIKEGTPKADALKILGSPINTLTAADTERQFYKSGEKYYSVAYSGDKVTGELMGPMTKTEYDEYQKTVKALMELLKQIDKKK